LVWRSATEIRRMKQVEGLSQREICRRTGIHRDTIRKALASPTPPSYAPRSRRPSKLDPFLATIEELLDDEPTLSRGDEPLRFPSSRYVSIRVTPVPQLNSRATTSASRASSDPSALRSHRRRSSRGRHTAGTCPSILVPARALSVLILPPCRGTAAGPLQRQRLARASDARRGVDALRRVELPEDVAIGAEADRRRVARLLCDLADRAPLLDQERHERVPQVVGDVAVRRRT
jgi:hypothetical protein